MATNNVNVYFNHKICSKCGGICCKLGGCFVSPTDKKDLRNEYIAIYSIPSKMFHEFLIPNEIKNKYPEEQMRAITSAEAQLSVYDEVFLVRMRSIEKPKFQIITDPSQFDMAYMPGQCVMLRPHGCAFSDKLRPLGGRALCPQPDFPYGCYSDYNGLSNALEWLHYHNQIEHLINR